MLLGEVDLECRGFKREWAECNSEQLHWQCNLVTRGGVRFKGKFCSGICSLMECRMLVWRGVKRDDARWGSRIPGENTVNRQLTMGSHRVLALAISRESIQRERRKVKLDEWECRQALPCGERSWWQFSLKSWYYLLKQEGRSSAESEKEGMNIRS